MEADCPRPDSPLLVYAESTDELPEAPNIGEFEENARVEEEGGNDVAVVDQNWQKQVLTDDHYSGVLPELSPDGGRIAFESSRGEPLVSGTELPQPEFQSIYVMDADGDDQRRLTGGPGEEGSYDSNPLWLAGGERIAFIPSTGPGLGAVDAGGGEAETLISEDVGSGEPELSPDGERVAYSDYRDVRTDFPPRTLRLAAPDMPEREIAGASYSDSEPSLPYEDLPTFSPGGERVAFVHREGSASNERVEIRTVDIGEAGAEPRPLISAEELGLEDFDEIEWSPDGRRMAFYTMKYPSFREVVGIIEMPSGGSSEPRLVWRGPGQRMQWTPDGEHLIYPGYDNEEKTPTGGMEAVTAKGEEVRLPEAAGEIDAGQFFDWGPCSLEEAR